MNKSKREDWVATYKQIILPFVNLGHGIEKDKIRSLSQAIHESNSLKLNQMLANLDSMTKIEIQNVLTKIPSEQKDLGEGMIQILLDILLKVNMPCTI